MSSKLIKTLWPDVLNFRALATQVRTIKSVRLRIIPAVTEFLSPLRELTFELRHPPQPGVSNSVRPAHSRHGTYSFMLQIIRALRIAYRNLGNPSRVI